jgi:hypothetical protein
MMSLSTENMDEKSKSESVLINTKDEEKNETAYFPQAKLC